MTDRKHDDVNALFRAVKDRNKFAWTPETDPDPAVRQHDRDALNQAIRRAAGRGEQEPADEPLPWKSVMPEEK